MNISFLPAWSYSNLLSDPAKETDRKSSEKVTDVALNRIASRTKRASSTAPRAISPLRLLLIAGLFCGVRGQGSGLFPVLFDLATLNGVNGFALSGEASDERSGSSVSSAGDVNGDGLADLLIGALEANPSGKTNAGKSYVVFGTRPPFSGGLLDLSTLNGVNGFAIPGEDAYDYSGRSVSSAGDVNGDGLADLLIGAPNADPSGKADAGKSYVVFGTRTPFSGGLLDLSTLNGTNGFALAGEAAGDFSGFSVSSAGDVNGDGLADLLIGASIASPSGKTSAGKSYVVFGVRRLFSGGLFNLATLNGTNGFAIAGEAAGDSSGFSVSSAGDANGDGLADLLIGAYNASLSGKNSAGKSYVVFGARTPFSGGLLDLSTLNGSIGFAIAGEVAGDHSGISVSSAGDVNGDGLADIVIGARRASPAGIVQAGKSYVVFGTRTPFSGGLFDLSTLNGTNGFAIPGEAAEDYSGWAVSSAADVNGDGLADLLIGALGASPSGKAQAGKSYVIFGRNMFNRTLTSTPRISTISLPSPSTFAIPTTSGSMSPTTLNTPTSSPSSNVTSNPSDGSSSTSTTNSNTLDTPTLSAVLVQSPALSSTVVIAIAGLAAAVAALACSLLGTCLYIKRAQARQSPMEAGTGLKVQDLPKLPANYRSLEAIQQGMASAREENHYAILPASSPQTHYDDPRKLFDPSV